MGRTWPDPKRPGSGLAPVPARQLCIGCAELHKVGLHAGAARLRVCAA